MKHQADFNAWVARSNNRDPISEFEKQETIMQVKLPLKYSIVNFIDDERIEKARLKVIVYRFKALIARVSEQITRVQRARKTKETKVQKRQDRDIQVDFKQNAKLETATL